MALSFPSSPAVGQTHTESGRSWKWTGTRWQRNDIAGSVVSDSQPQNPVPGMRWVNSATGRAFDYMDNTWVETSSGGGGGGVTSYNDLTDLPTLGSAAATASSDYATAAQGAKADSALQPSALTPYRTSAAQDVIDSGKASASHNHDERYYTEAEVDTFLAGKQAAGSYAPATGISPSAISGTAVVSTDSRLSDARQPLTHSHSVSDVTGLQTALDGKQAAGSYATLVGGLVPSTQLPSYVDDVIEAENFASLPAGEAGKIYVTLDTGKIYRWSGTAFVEISPSPGSTDAVPEGSSNLYFTAARAVSALATTLSSYATQAWVAAQGYATSSSVTAAISALVTGVSSVAGKTGAVTLAKGDVGLGNVDNTSDLAKPISTATQTALDGKAATSHTHENATTTVAGFMSAPDKIKLDGITSGGGATYTSEVNATGLKNVDFTNIPIGTKRITIIFRGLTTNVSASYFNYIQIGDSSGIKTNIYSSLSFSSSAQFTQLDSYVGFISRYTADRPSDVITTLCKVGSTNQWVSSHVGAQTSYQAYSCLFGGGTATLSGPLSVIRVTTYGTTGSYTSGLISVIYEG